MSRFINANPGLQSRFNKYYTFEDYKPNELLSIFEGICRQNHFDLNEKAKIVLSEKFTKLYANRDKSFGNGRLVRNIFEETIDRQANRLAKLSRISKEMMMEISSEDVP